MALDGRDDIARSGDVKATNPRLPPASSREGFRLQETNLKTRRHKREGPKTVASCFLSHKEKQMGPAYQSRGYCQSELKARRHQRAASGHAGPSQSRSNASTGQQRATEKKPQLIMATNKQHRALSGQTQQRSLAATTRVKGMRGTAASVGRRPSSTTLKLRRMLRTGPPGQSMHARQPTL